MDRCPQCKQPLRRAPKRPPNRVNGTTRAEDRAARRKARRAATAELRDVVFERAEEVCELCAFFTPSELHHLEGGAGRRREKQSEKNTVAVCGFCHRAWHHDGPRAFVDRVTAWAERHGYPLPKSITKVA